MQGLLSDVAPMSILKTRRPRLSRESVVCLQQLATAREEGSGKFNFEIIFAAAVIKSPLLTNKQTILLCSALLWPENVNNLLDISD